NAAASMRRLFWGGGMRITHNLSIASVLLLLMGCASAEQQRAQEAARHDPYCKSIGAGPGTPGYANCRLQLKQMEVYRPTTVVTTQQSEFDRPDWFKVPQIYPSR